LRRSIHQTGFAVCTGTKPQGGRIGSQGIRQDTAQQRVTDEKRMPVFLKAEAIEAGNFNRIKQRSIAMQQSRGTDGSRVTKPEPEPGTRGWREASDQSICTSTNARSR
jgi:hypothetical protein